MTGDVVHGRPWTPVLASAVVYDAWLIRYRHDSLSRHFADAARRRPVAVTVGVAYLLAHLYGVLPQRGDAFHLGVRACGHRSLRRTS